MTEFSSQHDLLNRPSRRAVVLAGGAIFGWSLLPKLASAAGARDPRFITIVLRGALDGLAAVPPAGDPAYASQRGELAEIGGSESLPLDGFFALHPSLKNTARLFRNKQALVLHACTTPYRSRSHFDGQDILESGQPRAGLTQSGWLNRAIGFMPASGQKASTRGLAVGATAPLVMRGAAPVAGWAPTRLRGADEDLLRRVLDLYSHRDPELAKALMLGSDIDAMARGGGAGEGVSAGGGRAYMQQIARSTAKLMAAPDGPRIAALAFDGWDTHAQETARLAVLLAGLDDALAEFESGLGAAWRETVIAVITEFGRTVRVNGTAGTDHGTGTAAFLAGGAVAGGRVIADWPGLRDSALHDGRDLAATLDVRSALKGVMEEHLGLPSAVVAADIFPGSAKAQPLLGLVKA
ncbi:MAG: DUF1501 domain-containing protein [Alphaproteobacteria bacterium]|nr:DUF1501 domain-containing protein [Alphaproteobacteria bacterium]